MAEDNSPAPQQSKNSAWDSVRSKANAIGSITALFAFLLAIGVAGGYFYSQSKKTTTTTDKKPVIQTLSQEDLNKLNEIGANLGTAGQTLNVGADALFRGKADVTGDLTVGGKLNANGPVTLSQLNITGNTAATGLNVGSNLNVTGLTSLQRAVTIGGLLTVNSNVNVTGTGSFGAVNTGSIGARTLSLSGPLTIGHISTQGGTPAIAAGSVGSGGTVSISGNDTAGTVNINTGTGPSGVLATITYRSTYGAGSHVQITPLTSDAAGSGYWVSRSAGGFQIHATTPPSGRSLSFDYLVVQ